MFCFSRWTFSYLTELHDDRGVATTDGICLWCHGWKKVDLYISLYFIYFSWKLSSIDFQCLRQTEVPSTTVSSFWTWTPLAVSHACSVTFFFQTPWSPTICWCGDRCIVVARGISVIYLLPVGTSVCSNTMIRDAILRCFQLLTPTAAVWPSCLVPTHLSAASFVCLAVCEVV